MEAHEKSMHRQYTHDERTMKKKTDISSFDGIEKTRLKRFRVWGRKKLRFHWAALNGIAFEHVSLVKTSIASKSRIVWEHLYKHVIVSTSSSAHMDGIVRRIAMWIDH